ncbi:MAG: hypothetical protein E5X61_10460 [Mesorhizobium sp.]|nr:MAG: hypothetical protein E5X61_10460 [Mesorhizobium sp.]
MDGLPEILASEPISSSLEKTNRGLKVPLDSLVRLVSNIAVLDFNAVLSRSLRKNHHATRRISCHFQRSTNLSGQTLNEPQARRGMTHGTQIETWTFILYRQHLLSTILPNANSNGRACRGR